MRGLFINDVGACSCAPIKRKEIAPAVLAAIIGAGATTAATVGNNIAASNLNSANRDFSREMAEKQNQFNAEQSQLAREQQSALLTQEQDWQEQMYNLYNSPSAMMRQYREAGMNPYLVDASHFSGASMTSPSAPSSPQATASSVPNLQTYPLDFSGIGSGFAQFANMYLQAKQVDANVANVSAKTLSEGADAYTKMRGHGMSHDDAMKLVMPFFKGTQGFDANSGMFFNILKLDYQTKELEVKRQDLQYQLDKQFGSKERQNKLNETDQLITESVARIGMMASDRELNDAKIKQLAQDCVESLSRIYRNTAEGALAEEQGFQLLSLFPYIESSAQIQGEREEFDKETTFGNKGVQNFSKTFLGKGVNLFLYYLGRAMSAGNVGVNVGYKVGK